MNALFADVQHPLPWNLIILMLGLISKPCFVISNVMLSKKKSVDLETISDLESSVKRRFSLGFGGDKIPSSIRSK